jgi:hypothetical protein
MASLTNSRFYSGSSATPHRLSLAEALLGSSMAVIGLIWRYPQAPQL